MNKSISGGLIMVLMVSLKGTVIIELHSSLFRKNKNN